MTTLIVKRGDRDNLGDWMSNPADYFDLDPCRVVDVFDEPDLRGVKRIVVGGGGMFHFEPEMRRLLEACGDVPVVGWGIGTNKHGVEERHCGGVDLSRFALLGIRDKGADDFVPCPSCMHPAIVQKPGFGVVCYQHKDERHLGKIGFPCLTNDCRDFNRVVRFLQSAETVITNTYHGWYWGVLLGKKVIVYRPFSSKFFHLPWPVAMPKTLEELKACLKHDHPTYPEALSEARRLNEEFYQRVLSG
jgi:hypothetical protein